MIEPQVASARNLNQILRMAALVGDESPEQTHEEQASDLDALDIGAWETEKAPEPAETDQSVLAAAQEVFAALATHEPIDSSVGWEDFEADLPDRAFPLARPEDAEARAKLRLLLLRAIREGSIPGNDVHEHSSNLDGSTNGEGEAFLTMVANDLGAEVDERFEYQNGHENFKVAVDPVESAEEEAAVDEALAAIDSATSRRYDPLRMFQREFQRYPLLSAHEEVELAQAMESSLRGALEALCSWPEGIQRAIAEVSNAKLAGTSAATPSMDQEEDAVVDHRDSPSLDLHTMDSDGDPSESESSIARNGAQPEPNDSIPKLVAMACSGESNPENRAAIQAALCAIQDNPTLLSKLAIKVAASDVAKRFASAVEAFFSARDKMVTANIKLAFHVAKKHMRSGELLDDLTQEATIGLLKAVDRYDWRRGFRFSTYATWWIRQMVTRHVADKCRTIRFPVHVHEKHQSMLRQSQEFEATRGRAPTVEELSAILELTVRKTAELQNLPAEPTHIDEDGIDASIAIEAQDVFISPDPSDLAERAELRSLIDSMLVGLSKKEQQIIRLRYGLDGAEPLTLDDVGRRFELTRERIRQIESAAIKKLASHGAAFKPPKKRGRPPKEESATTEERQSDAGESQPHATEKPMDMNALLMRAEALGLRVEDRRDSPSAMVWVRSYAAPAGPISLIAPWLEEFGFKLWPGEGYWK